MKTQEVCPSPMMSKIALPPSPQSEIAESSPLPVPPATGRRLDTVAIWAFALLIAFLAARLAFFSSHNVWVDELGLYNPIYMYLHYGKMTYPIHHQFDEMVVHPPTHYLVIAWLMKLGLNLYHAEAVPPFVLTALILFFVCRSAFPNVAKLGLLFGIFSVVNLYYCQMSNFFAQLRPDTVLTLAVMAGLVALESARLEGWNCKRLFLGSFLLTYASGLHYPGGVAFTGVIVYLVWVWWALGFAQAKRRILALVGGGCLFGIPFVALFVLPNWKDMWTFISAVQGNGGISHALARHFAQYDWTRDFIGMTKLANVSFFSLPLQKPLSLHIPLVGITTVLLLLVPATRGIALAGLPVPLFVLLYSQAKSGGYFLPEFALYMLAVILATLLLAEKIIHRVGFGLGRAAFIPAATLALGFSYHQAHPVWINRGLPEHDMDIARAAARDMLGTDALVASRLGGWYASGATHWFDPSSELLWRNDIHDNDVRTFFRPFDAVVEYPHMSEYAVNNQRATLATWYVDGTLYLRGFYFLQDNPNCGSGEIGQLFLNVERPKQLRGYVMKNRQLYRFDQEIDGDIVVASLIGRMDGFRMSDFPGVLFYNIILMPKREPTDPQKALFTVVLPRKEYQPHLTALAAVYQIHDEFVGRLHNVDPKELLAKARQEEQTIRFYRTHQEAVQRGQK